MSGSSRGSEPGAARNPLYRVYSERLALLKEELDWNRLLFALPGG